MRGTVSRTQLAVFCFRYRIQERDCRSHGVCTIYIYPHANMAVHRCTRDDVDCIRSIHETRFFPPSFFTRATRRRRNSKCVSRLFQWTTLLSEMYMRKTVKVGISYNVYMLWRACSYHDDFICVYEICPLSVRFVLLGLQKKLNTLIKYIALSCKRLSQYFFIIVAFSN